ncbi:hypothetical protein ALC53_04348 [Atta colombica]|uniref:Double jelly roll-like domain-containing protein n=1 Tax=Atta colombica TaxID=520822 RepID=A0A151I4H2_9HYME|nr:hypothetical protein ALC53_04348 [Atta colombica]
MALKKRYELFPTPNITGKPVFDDRIVNIETYTYNPFALQHSGTAMIRIPIQQGKLTNRIVKGANIIIDCSRQNELVKNGTVDVRLDFEYKKNVPANTTAYCFIIHDRVIQYNALTQHCAQNYVSVSFDTI